MGTHVVAPVPVPSSGCGGRPRARRRGALALLALWLAAGCASDLVRRGDRFYQPRQHFSIGVPGGYGPPWERIDIDGAWIAFRRPGPQILSLQTVCGRPVAHPAIMARNLVVGVKERHLLQAGPVVIAGQNGWSQTFDTRTNGVAERVKTVTLVVDGCTWDWALVAAGDFGPAERAFDAWWATFRFESKGGDEERRS